VEAIAEKCFNGRLPDAPLVICCAIAETCFPFEARVEVLEVFFEKMLAELEELIVAQDTRWSN
jgi:hypothetical protein